MSWPSAENHLNENGLLSCNQSWDNRFSYSNEVIKGRSRLPQNRKFIFINRSACVKYFLLSYKNRIIRLFQKGNRSA
jgi:hypothetical protein